MKRKIFSLVMSLLLFGPLAAQANTVDASYTISGSAGNWLYDFSFTNNIGGTNNIYAVVLTMPNTTTIAGSPTSWGQGSFTPIEWCYASNCGYFGGTNLAPGDTLSGFLVRDTAVTPLSSIGWAVYAEGGTYFGSDNINNYYNPGFAGTMVTPLPAALPLFATGLGALGLLGWRRKRKAAPQPVS